MNLAKTILTVAALMGSGTAFAGVPAWTVSETSGAVQLSRPGLQSVAASRGGALHAGDVISTGKSGRAVLVRGEEYLVVSPGTRIVIAEPKAGAMTQIIQSVGNTLFKIKKMATPHFAVETPYLAAVVKGTTFSVTVTGNGASVQVTEGRVQVATPDGGASYLVTPGEIGLVNRDMPYRLTVQGRETRTIDSPNRPAGGAAPAPETAAPVETASAFEGGIERGIGEGPVRLDSLSGGLIGGDSSLAAAATQSRVTALLAARTGSTDRNPDAASDGSLGAPVVEGTGTLGVTGSETGGVAGIGSSGTGSAGGIPVDGGNVETGTGSGNAGSAGSGNGNGNSGNGSGNGSGSGSSGGGNGSGNSGNGNGNGGGDGSSGGGNGNGNSGNGNGNGGGDGSSGGGNGNGNSGNGNGNGGGDGSSGGGNGNGNSGNGNGNGNNGGRIRL